MVVVLHHEPHPEPLRLPTRRPHRGDHRRPARGAIPLRPPGEGPDEARAEALSDADPLAAPRFLGAEPRAIGHPEVVHQGDVDDLQAVARRGLPQRAESLTGGLTDVFVLEFHARETQLLGQALRLGLERGNLSTLPSIRRLPERNARQG